MKTIKQILSLFFLASVYPAAGAVLYVSPGGDDTGSGTVSSPYKTPQTALSAMASGDTVYLRGGTYSLSTQVKPSKVGTSTAYCCMFAYPGELPVFDFSGLDSNTRGISVTKDYWHIRGIEVKNATSNGICLSTGGYGIIEGCVSHDNALEGVKLTNGAHDDLILNCDSYLNYDAANHGENADGFAAKSGIGTGNVFRGCRAWLNSDDGWDLYGCPKSVVMDSCWAFRNGQNLWGDASFAGDGNAFKLGGAADTTEHLVTRSVAFDNVSKGFDQNYNKAGQTMYNCTAYRNGGSDFSFYQTPTAGTLKKHVIINAIAYAGEAPDVDSTAQQESVSWKGFTVSSSDFVSLDTSLALAARKSDYSLPNNGFLRLVSTSSMVDKGVDVGFVCSGTAPDLGAFEYSGTVALAGACSRIETKNNIDIRSAASGIIQLSFNSEKYGTAVFSMVDLSGKTVMPERQLIINSGNNNIHLDLHSIARGFYICCLKYGNMEHKRLVAVKY